MVRFSRISKRFVLQKSFTGKPLKYVHALNNVSFEAYRGQSTGIVGESGSGKSTLIRLFMGLYQPDSGFFSMDEMISTYMQKADWNKLRRRAAMVFQDPWGSLNPRLRIQDILTEPLAIHGSALQIPKSEWANILYKTLDSVGLPQSCLTKYPHEFSGGQRQRIGIARALILKPSLILLDEPVSALDVSIQAQILNLLSDLRSEFNLTYLFIAHDLGVVRYLCDRIVVMYAGRVMEVSDSESLFENPRHPYTKTLLNAMPSIEKLGQIPEAEPEVEIVENQGGCPFVHRCSRVMEICHKTMPEASTLGTSTFYCHNPMPQI